MFKPPRVTMCRFTPAWTSRCNKPTVEGEEFCDQHIGKECRVCKSPATHECSYAGQFVCGAPLCDDCEGWNDSKKPSGGWGFLNHFHRKKKTAVVEENKDKMSDFTLRGSDQLR